MYLPRVTNNHRKNQDNKHKRNPLLSQNLGGGGFHDGPGKNIHTSQTPARTRRGFCTHRVGFDAALRAALGGRRRAQRVAHDHVPPVPVRVPRALVHSQLFFRLRRLGLVGVARSTPLPERGRVAGTAQIPVEPAPLVSWGARRVADVKHAVFIFPRRQHQPARGLAEGLVFPVFHRREGVRQGDGCTVGELLAPRTGAAAVDEVRASCHGVGDAVAVDVDKAHVCYLSRRGWRGGMGGAFEGGSVNGLARTAKAFLQGLP